MKKREYYRTILQHGPTNRDYAEAVEWWKTHRGKDFTKHYETGDWIKSDYSIAFVKNVVSSGNLSVIRFNNSGDIVDNAYTLNSSRPFYPIYPKEFITTPRDNTDPGVWESIFDNPDSEYHGNRSLVYGQIVDGELHGTLIHADYYASPVGDFSTCWAIPEYKPVNMEIKL